MINTPFIIEQFSDDDVRWLGTNGEILHLHHQDVIVRQFAETNKLFIVIKGELSAFIKSIGEVAKFNSGDVIGELSFINSKFATATVMSNEDSTVFTIDNQILLERIKENPVFGLRFYKAISIFLADRLSIMNRNASLIGKEGLFYADTKKEYDYSLIGDKEQRQIRFNWIIKTLSSAKEGKFVSI